MRVQAKGSAIAGLYVTATVDHHAIVVGWIRMMMRGVAARHSRNVRYTDNRFNRINYLQFIPS
jgi:hypothetical protein